jgi:hypothetical protein
MRKLKQESLEIEGEKRRNVTQPSRSVLGSLLGVCGQHVPSNLSLTCKKQQAKACWKCCKNTKYVTENFCFLHRNFQQ